MWCAAWCVRMVGVSLSIPILTPLTDTTHVGRKASMTHTAVTRAMCATAAAAARGKRRSDEF